MRRGLRPEDLGDLLEKPFTCTLATYRKDGQVLLSPVWFVWDDSAFQLLLVRRSAAALHLERDPRCSVVLYESEPPLRAIEIRGRGEVFEEGVTEVRKAMWLRYTGTAPPGSGENEIGIRVTGETRCWDFADDYESWLQA